MIYQFVAWLETFFPNETIYSNVRLPIGSAQSIPDRCVLVRETGGEERRVIDVPTVQVLVRDLSVTAVKRFAQQIYDTIQSTAGIGGRFGQVLPSVTVDGVTYPQIQTAQISSLALPESIGTDQNGRNEFSMNFQIYKRR